MMGELLERQKLLHQIFDEYDIMRDDELDARMVQLIHADMRVGGISLPQVHESIQYACVGDRCEKSELWDLLQEMDRRYFLVQQFCWEFTMLDQTGMDNITEEQAKWFIQTVHGQFFSQNKWERFLRNRSVPGSGVSFAEIEVMLCNIPSKEEWLQEMAEEQREREERERQQKDMERLIEEEKRKRKLQREEEKTQREDVERKTRMEEERRRLEEEEERQRRLKEREDAERRRRQLEEEEERGRKEAEERERKERNRLDQEEKDRRSKEERELERLEELKMKQEEQRRRQEIEEAGQYESILEDAIKREKEAEDEAIRHGQRLQEAKDDRVKKDAEDAERGARLRQKEYQNKRIRYNLKVAIKKRDRERLPPAVDAFKKAKLPDDDMDLAKAEKLLKEFQARDGLKKAMTSRQLQELERAINYIKRNGFEFQLEKELIEANKILLQLRRLERIRAEILELKQSTVAEIRSYQKPPVVVHIVMTGTFLLLGNKEKETKDWKTVQALVGKTGKDGLKRRCLGCDPGQIPRDAAKRAKALLSSFDLDDVRDVSAGAATFYVWSWTMIEELEARIEAKKQEEEDKKLKEETAASEEIQRDVKSDDGATA